MADASPAVYVIDDDASVREAVRSLLWSAGLRREGFVQASGIVQAEQSGVPSCVVLDVRFPGVSGLELQDELKKAGIRVPIILINASGGVPVASLPMNAGAVESFGKSFQRQDLMDAINQALDLYHRRREQPAENLDDSGIGLLNRMAGRISGATPMHEVLKEVIGFVASVVECDSCFVYVLEDGELVLRASKNPHPEWVDRLKLKLGQGITGWVAEHREPVVVTSNAFMDPRFKLFNGLPEDRFEAFLSVPLVSGGRLVGVINLQDRAEHQFSPREINLIATVGFLVGAEVERSRLESENSVLSGRLEARKVVERAKGILQRDLRISEEDAYRSLRRESQQRRKSMKEISEAIILSDDLRRGSR